MEPNQVLLNHDLLRIFQKNELLYCNNERSVIIPTMAFGVLQRDLIENIGIERMKSFFFKYGWHLGKEDVKAVIHNDSLSFAEKIEYGPKIHALKGHAKSKITDYHLEIEGNKVKSIRYHGKWEKSFEAAQHMENLGRADEPVCFTLAGYASGYVSALIGEVVIFKETQCEGQGAPCCIWEGLRLTEWQEKGEELQYSHKELPVIKELEQTYQKLLIEKNNLSLVTKIHADLTDEVIKGNNIQSILDIVNHQINLPVIVENIHHQVLAKKGISVEKYQPYQQEFYDFLKKNQSIENTKVIHLPSGSRLVTPVFLDEKIIGYCSFLYSSENSSNLDIDSMIIGRVSNICTLLFFKEKTELESMERVKGHFLEEIISGKYVSAPEIIRKASFLNLNLTDCYYVIYLKYQVTRQCREKELTLHTNIFEAVSSFFNEKQSNVLIGQRADSLILLITEKQFKEQNIEKNTHSLLSYLKKHIKNVLFLAGISKANDNIIEAAVAFEEGRSAARLCSREKPITSFNELGVIGVLINEHNEKALRKIIRDTLGKLYENLDSNKIDLIDTLYHFLVNGGNLEQTAVQLALSISGLRYRLNKITDLLKQDLRNPQVSFQLLIALKALKIIDHHLFEK